MPYVRIFTTEEAYAKLAQSPSGLNFLEVKLAQATAATFDLPRGADDVAICWIKLMRAGLNHPQMLILAEIAGYAQPDDPILTDWANNLAAVVNKMREYFRDLLPSEGDVEVRPTKIPATYLTV